MASTTPSTPHAPDATPEPAWEIARLFPPQGCWSESDYLSFTESISQLVELVNGRIEVPEMSTKTHQRIVHALLGIWLAFFRDSQAGDAVAAPYRVWLKDGTFREPDIAVCTAAHLDQFGERFGRGADVVVEVVSDDLASRTRDYEDKRRDYAAAGIPEYWLVDPAAGRIRLLVWKDGAYEVGQDAGVGQQVASRVFPGFQVAVGALFAPAG